MFDRFTRPTYRLPVDVDALLHRFKNAFVVPARDAPARLPSRIYAMGDVMSELCDLIRVTELRMANY